ncbi:MAG: hypothetical protein J0H11_15120 [Rhizobiales bacterium]|nr:hypothetical protein [Hyphomicrobiales bacterium]
MTDSTSLATRKFEFEDIVNADPLCPPAALKVVRAYLPFVRDFEKDAVWRSNIDLQVATGLSERHIIDTRRRLIELGYFEEAGKTGAGAVRYRLRLERENLVLDHQMIARESLRRMEADRKNRQRLKRQATRSVTEDSSVTQGVFVTEDFAGTADPVPCKKFRAVTEDSSGNYLDRIPTEGSLYEKEGYWELEDTRVEAGPADDERPDALDVPYPAPASEDDLERTLADLFDGCRLSPNLITAMRKMLMAGRLTPAIVAHQREVAA